MGYKETFKKALDQVFALNGSPHSIALGFAFGFYVSTTPFWGIQTLIALLFAFLLRVSRASALAGVHFHILCFPLLPAFYALEYKIGHVLIDAWPGLWPMDFDATVLKHFDFHDLGPRTAFDLGFPILLGSILIGLPASLIVYRIVAKGAALFQAKRRRGRARQEPNKIDPR